MKICIEKGERKMKICTSIKLYINICAHTQWHCHCIAAIIIHIVVNAINRFLLCVCILTKCENCLSPCHSIMAPWNSWCQSSGVRSHSLRKVENWFNWRWGERVWYFGVCDAHTSAFTLWRWLTARPPPPSLWHRGRLKLNGNSYPQFACTRHMQWSTARPWALITLSLAYIAFAMKDASFVWHFRCVYELVDCRSFIFVWLA